MSAAHGMMGLTYHRLSGEGVCLFREWVSARSEKDCELAAFLDLLLRVHLSCLVEGGGREGVIDKVIG